MSEQETRREPLSLADVCDDINWMMSPGLIHSVYPCTISPDGTAGTLTLDAGMRAEVRRAADVPPLFDVTITEPDGTSFTMSGTLPDLPSRAAAVYRFLQDSCRSCGGSWLDVYCAGGVQHAADNDAGSIPRAAHLEVVYDEDECVTEVVTDLRMLQRYLAVTYSPAVDIRPFSFFAQGDRHEDASWPMSPVASSFTVDGLLTVVLTPAAHGFTLLCTRDGVGSPATRCCCTWKAAATIRHHLPQQRPADIPPGNVDWSRSVYSAGALLAWNGPDVYVTSVDTASNDPADWSATFTVGGLIGVRLGSDANFDTWQIDITQLNLPAVYRSSFETLEDAARHVGAAYDILSPAATWDTVAGEAALRADRTRIELGVTLLDVGFERWARGIRADLARPAATP